MTDLEDEQERIRRRAPLKASVRACLGWLVAMYAVFAFTAFSSPNVSLITTYALDLISIGGWGVLWSLVAVGGIISLVTSNIYIARVVLSASVAMQVFWTVSLSFTILDRPDFDTRSLPTLVLWLAPGAWAFTKLVTSVIDPTEVPPTTTREDE